MIVLALLVNSEDGICREVDGLDGTLPSFTLEFGPCAIACAAALKEADPDADVTLEVREVDYDWTAVAALSLAQDAFATVLVVATAWRMRWEMAAEMAG